MSLLTTACVAGIDLLRVKIGWYSARQYRKSDEISPTRALIVFQSSRSNCSNDMSAKTESTVTSPAGCECEGGDKRSMGGLFGIAGWEEISVNERFHFLCSDLPRTSKLETTSKGILRSASHFS